MRFEGETYPEIARSFATWAHRAQTRKWTGELYIGHPIEVAEILQETILGVSPMVIAAAYLHDVLEDTEVTFEELAERFGHHIVGLVDALTDRQTAADGNRAYRKTVRCKQLAESSYEVQSIKYADLLSNWPSIRDNDPKFAVIYRKEALDLCDAMTKGNMVLRSWLRAELR